MSMKDSFFLQYVGTDETLNQYLNGGIYFQTNEYILFETPCEDINWINYNKCYKFIPNHLIDDNLSLSVVSNNGNNLQYIPTLFKTIHLCYIAVNNNLSAIQFVPNDFIHEIAIHFIYKDFLILKYIPTKFIT